MGVLPVGQADRPRRRASLGGGHAATRSPPPAWRLLVAGCLILLAAIPAWAEPSPLVFLADEGLAPFAWLEGGAAQGLVVDLARAAALRAGLNARVDAVAWAHAQQRVLDGEADALVPLTPSPQRDKLYDFSGPLLESSFPIFRLASRTDIWNLATLLGRRVGVEPSGVALELLRQHPAIQLVVLPQREDAFKLLAAGQLDAVVADRWAGEYTLHQLGLDGVTAVEPPLATSTARIAVRKGNQPLLARIDQGLAGIAEDGSAQRILEKWRPKPIDRRTPRRTALSVTLGHASAAMLALFSLAYLGKARAAHARLRNRHDQLEHEIGERQRAESSLRDRLATLEARVAELARTADALRASETRYRRLIDHLGDAHAVFDSEGRLVDCNEAFGTMLGYSVEELRGTPGQDLTPPQWRARENAVVVGQLLKGEASARYEKEYQRKDGTLVPVQVHACVVRDEDGHPSQTWAIVHRLPQRRDGKPTLHDPARQEPVILEHLGFGVMVLRHRRLVWGNRQLGEMMGCDVRELIGHPTSSFYAFGADKLYRPDDENGESGTDVLARGEKFERDVQGRRRNGETFWAHLSALAVDTADPQAGIVVCVEDITERKRAADELRAAREAAEAADRAKDLFLAGMGFEIRTPLNAILGMADLIERSGVTPSQAQRLDEIRRAGRHLLRLADDVPGLPTTSQPLPAPAAQAGAATGATAGPGRGRARAPARARDDESECRRIAAGKRVLLVEDEPINREVAACLLTELGLVVDSAEDGATAVRMAAEHDFDLIVMDLQMPRMDGLEATRQIRRSPNGATVPIVALTANAHDGARDACQAAGMDDFLTKPIDMRRLYATLIAQLGPDKAASASG